MKTNQELFGTDINVGTRGRSGQMLGNAQIDKLVNFLLGEIAKSSYLSKPSQFNDGDTKFQEGRLSALNEMVVLLTDED